MTVYLYAHIVSVRVSSGGEGPLLTCNQTNADIADIASFKSAKHFHTNIDVHYIMIQFKVRHSCEQICPMTGLIPIPKPGNEAT